MCSKGITQFYLTPTHKPYLPLLHSRKVSPPFGWYSLRLPTKGWPGWVDLGGWLHTEINVPHREFNLDTVTRPCTNWAWRRLTSLIETNTLPLRRTPSISSTVGCCYFLWGIMFLGQYQIILLSDRGTQVWTTCPMYCAAVHGQETNPCLDLLITLCTQCIPILSVVYNMYDSFIPCSFR